MNHALRPRMSSRPLSLLALGLTFAACAPADETLGGDEELVQGSYALLGQTTGDGTCNDAQRAMLNDSVRYGRVAASTSLFNQCVHNAVLGPSAVSLGGLTIGPYVPCTGDENYSLPRATQADRAFAAATGNNPVEFRCDGTQGIASAGERYAWNHTNPERFSVTANLLNSTVATMSNPVCPRDANGNPITNGTCAWAPRPWPYTTYANTFWHEAIHTHGYGHGINSITEDPSGAGRTACGVAAGVPFHFQQNTMPYLVGSCVEGVISASYAACGEPRNNPQCRSDQYRMLTSALGTPAVCGCVDDPMLPRFGDAAWGVFLGGFGTFATMGPSAMPYRYNETARAWTNIGGPGRAFAVNDRGFYAITSDGAHVMSYSNAGVWSVIGGAATQLIVGSNALYATNPATGDLWRYENTPNAWTRVGSAGARFVANDVGLYALSTDRRNVLRFNGSTWTVIGGAASNLFAGPGFLYAVDSSGTYVTRFNGTVWEQIANDPYGIFFGGGELVATRAGVYRRRGNVVYRHVPVAGALNRWDVFTTNALGIYASRDQLVVQRLPNVGLYCAVAP